MAGRKMAAHHKRAVTKVMKSARKRKPTGRKVKFTTAEKSTLRHVMTEHSRKRKSPAKRKTTRKYKASGLRKAVVRKRKSPVRKRKAPASARKRKAYAERKVSSRRLSKPRRTRKPW